MNSIAHKLFVIPEVTYGVTPTSPTWAPIRYNSVTLGINKGSVKSAEIRPDRQVSDVRHGNRQLGGDIISELTYGDLDTLFQAALCGTWANVDIPATVSTLGCIGNHTFASSTTNVPVMRAGQRVTLAGFSNSANNGTFVIVSSTSSGFVVSSGRTPVTEAAGATITVTPVCQKLDAYTTQRSFSILRRFTDLDSSESPFHVHTGCEVNSFKLEVKPETNISVTFAFVGKDITPATAAPSGSTYGTPGTTKTFIGFVGGITIAGSAVAVITDIQLSAENGITPKFVLFDQTTGAPSIGTFNVSGQLTAYFENATLYNQFLAESAVTLAFRLVDQAENQYEFVMPRVKFTGAQPDVKGGPVMLTLPFHATLGDAGETALTLFKN